MTNTQIIELWLAGRPKGTMDIYRQIAMSFDRSIDCPFGRVTEAAVIAYLHTLNSRSDRSRMHTLSVIKSLMTFSEEKKLIERSPLRGLKIRRRQPQAMGVLLAREDVQRLIAAARTERNRMLVKLYYLTGMRTSELVSLHRRDMLTDADGGGSLRVLGKGNKWRIIKIDQHIWEELDRFACRAPHSPVFKSRKGGSLGRKAAALIVGECGRNAGLPGTVSPVRLRHAHVTHRLDQGGDIRAIKRDCGHVCLSATQYYIHEDGNEPVDNLAI